MQKAGWVSDWVLSDMACSFRWAPDCSPATNPACGSFTRGGGQGEYPSINGQIPQNKLLIHLHSGQRYARSAQLPLSGPETNDWNHFLLYCSLELPSCWAEFSQPCPIPPAHCELVLGSCNSNVLALRMACILTKVASQPSVGDRTLGRGMPRSRQPLGTSDSAQRPPLGTETK